MVHILATTSSSSFAADSTSQSPDPPSGGDAPQSASTGLVQAWTAAGEPGLPVGPFHFLLTRLDAMQAMQQRRQQQQEEQQQQQAPQGQLSSASGVHDREQEATSPAPAIARRATKRPTMNRSDLSRKSLLQRGKLVTSSFRGVNLHARSNRWDAHIWDGRQVHLGCFMCEQQAAIAYDLMAIKVKGPKAYDNLNYPAEAYTSEILFVHQMTKDSLLKKLRQSNLLMRGAMQQLPHTSELLTQLKAFLANAMQASTRPPQLAAPPAQHKPPSLRVRPIHSISSTVPHPPSTYHAPLHRSPPARPTPKSSFGSLATHSPPPHPPQSPVPYQHSPQLHRPLSHTTILPPRLRTAHSSHAPSLTPHPKPLKRTRALDIDIDIHPSIHPFLSRPLPTYPPTLDTSHPPAAAFPPHHPTHLPTPTLRKPTPAHPRPHSIFEVPSMLDLPSIDWPTDEAPPSTTCFASAAVPDFHTSQSIEDLLAPHLLSSSAATCPASPAPADARLTPPLSIAMRKVTLRPESPITSTCLHPHPDCIPPIICPTPLPTVALPFRGYPLPAGSPQPVSLSVSTAPHPANSHASLANISRSTTAGTTTTTSTATTYYPSSTHVPLARCESLPMSSNEFAAPPHHPPAAAPYPPAYPSHDDPALSAHSSRHLASPHDEMSVSAYAPPTDWPLTPATDLSTPPTPPHDSCPPLPHIASLPAPDVQPYMYHHLGLPHDPAPSPHPCSAPPSAPRYRPLSPSDPAPSTHGSAPLSPKYLSTSILPPKLRHRHLYTCADPQDTPQQPPFVPPSSMLRLAPCATYPRSNTHTPSHPCHYPVHRPPSTSDAYPPLHRARDSYTFLDTSLLPVQASALLHDPPHPGHAPHHDAAEYNTFYRAPSTIPAPASLNWPATHIPGSLSAPPEHAPPPLDLDDLPSLTDMLFSQPPNPTPPLSRLAGGPGHALHPAPPGAHGGHYYRHGSPTPAVPHPHQPHGSHLHPSRVGSLSWLPYADAGGGLEAGDDLW